MRIAVLGAGMTGLVAARRLALQGHDVDVYERWPGLGGQVATLDIGEQDPLERYYHHLFTSDVHITALYEDLGMGDQVEWRPSTMAMFADGRQHPFTSPLDLLRFKPISPLTRVRMGVAVVLLQRRHGDVGPFEQMTAHAWIRRQMGDEAWKRVWRPLLRNKFGGRAEDISMAWLWSKFTLRRGLKGQEARQEMLGYPRGGWQPLLDQLEHEIESNHGRVMINRPAVKLSRANGRLVVTPGVAGSFRRGHDPRNFDPEEETESYDRVLATVPNDVFEALLDEDLREETGRPYLERLQSIEYHTALCLLLELERPFSPYYWTNIAEDDLPFVGLIEHTNFVEPARYGGRRFLYVANYMAPGDPLLELAPDELIKRYFPGLRRVNPAFSLSWIRDRWLFREPAAQPIVTVGYRDRIPAMATPATGIFLANTTQIYPEDRGTNYSVRLAETAATKILRIS